MFSIYIMITTPLSTKVWWRKREDRKWLYLLLKFSVSWTWNNCSDYVIYGEWHAPKIYHGIIVLIMSSVENDTASKIYYFWIIFVDFEITNHVCSLAYLHEGLEPRIVHRDVKSSNILLDRQWNPKVSDFGLAKLLCSERSYVTTRVMGTFGWVQNLIKLQIYYLP